jgi:hypothetical protein
MEDWYRPVAQWLVAPFAEQRVRLIVNVTKIGFGHRLMVIGLAYRNAHLAASLERALRGTWTHRWGLVLADPQLGSRRNCPTAPQTQVRST